MSGEVLNEKLLKAIPAASHILELAPRNDALEKAYLQAHPQAKWMSLAPDDLINKLKAAGSPDIIVFDRLLERLMDPQTFLLMLKEAHPDARIVCCVSNASHISVLERLMSGDLMYDDAGPLAREHLRLFTAASAFKLLLDAGWLPAMVENYAAAPRNLSFFQHAVITAKQLRSPEDTAKRHMLIERLIISCIPSPKEEARPKRKCGLSVVVPVTDPLQLELNVLRSPGLREIGAKVCPIKDAKSSADAFTAGRKLATEEWILYCHQDIYLPAGSGKALLAKLASIDEKEAPSEIIGFSGLAMKDKNTAGQAMQAGLVVDRVNLLDFPESENGISVDELAVILHKNTPHAIDPALGWHTWATDLCLNSILRMPAHKYARILHIPIFHNSLSPWTLPAGYCDSAGKILAKYPELQSIPTLCGVLSRKSA